MRNGFHTSTAGDGFSWVIPFLVPWPRRQQNPSDVCDIQARQPVASRSSARRLRCFVAAGSAWRPAPCFCFLLCCETCPLFPFVFSFLFGEKRAREHKNCWNAQFAHETWFDGGVFGFAERSKAETKYALWGGPHPKIPCVQRFPLLVVSGGKHFQQLCPGLAKTKMLCICMSAIGGCLNVDCVCAILRRFIFSLPGL